MPRLVPARRLVLSLANQQSQSGRAGAQPRGARAPLLHGTPMSEKRHYLLLETLSSTCARHPRALTPADPAPGRIRPRASPPNPTVTSQCRYYVVPTCTLR
ncbi:hypothetical protein T492DRAFT_1111139 [Pavlovales sp. CCMP2436]|nr:hypothetical protein T492DRAFT_1111961 [Pavlovales sp. CCMP2436]KAJ1615752.1 hypothetical protein T492DRAFT_1111139 [Pavlovales sp. CCMP2436]